MSFRKFNNNEYGITLIALVVTIVVLLILAGITISLVFSENGIIAKAREAANKTNQAVEREQDELNQLYNELASALNNTTGGSTEEPELPADGSYSETKGVNTPNLGEGMTAIKWDGSGWEETTGSDPEWYDYSSKKWANAKTVDGSMWVWIPRYAYNIPSAGYHMSTAKEISIEFMKGTSNEGATGKTIVGYNNKQNLNNNIQTYDISWDVSGGEQHTGGSSQDDDSAQKFPNGYVIHPAFNYGETVSGIWVAKFEASQSDAIASDVGSSGVIKVQPGVRSWRDISVNDIYTNCLNYDSITLGNANLNSHMMKNNEWGAVAYLSRSRYGKNDEVTINDSSSFYTGGGSENEYVNNGAQSTTGNVWGVYDMSGGAWEYVAAYVDNGNSSLTNYGNSLYTSTEAKTKNVYEKASLESQTNNYQQNKGVYGDAVYETSTNGNGTTSWYGDYSKFLSTSNPFFIRGGVYLDGSSAGVFSFLNNSGVSYENISFRPVLVEL